MSYGIFLSTPLALLVFFFSKRSLNKGLKSRFDFQFNQLSRLCKAFLPLVAFVYYFGSKLVYFRTIEPFYSFQLIVEQEESDELRQMIYCNDGCNPITSSLQHPSQVRLKYTLVVPLLYSKFLFVFFLLKNKKNNSKKTQSD